MFAAIATVNLPRFHKPPLRTSEPQGMRAYDFQLSEFFHLECLFRGFV